MYGCSKSNSLFWLWEVAVSFSCERLLFSSNFSDSGLPLISLILQEDQMRVCKIDFTKAKVAIRVN